MSGPWFRRYAGFSYRPATKEGRIVLAAMGLVAIPAGVVWLWCADTRPTLAAGAAAIAVLSAIIGHAIVIWKMDWATAFDSVSFPPKTDTRVQP